jgi:hypothetical protein
MTDVAATLNRFQHDLVQVERKWGAYTIKPYALAYETGYLNFKDKIKEQEDADKLKAELIMLALSLCGGGVMTAAFGTIALKSLASKAAIHVICNNNMERAFKAAHFVATNKTANFIVGSVWDELEKRGKDYATGKLKTAIESMAQQPVAFPSAQKVTTIAVKTSLEMFIEEAAIKAYDLAVGIGDDPRLSANEKIKKLTDMRTSKLWKPPEGSVDDGSLSDEIELSFYMNMVMNSDYLKTTTYRKVMRHDGLARSPHYEPVTTRTDISESARSKDYPQEFGNQEIGYKRIGGIIEDRINELHRKKFKEKFYDGDLDVGVMLKAEDTIERLADYKIKQRIAGAAK